MSHEVHKKKKKKKKSAKLETPKAWTKLSASRLCAKPTTSPVNLNHSPKSKHAACLHGVPP